jgi:SOS-response transcriptional repressor LexA
MIDDGILDGDYLLITPSSTVANGAIGVAIHNTANGGRGAATLKRVFRRSDGVQLQPANAELSARYITAEEWDREWSVQGTVVAVYRRYL